MLDFILYAIYALLLIDNVYQHRVNSRMKLELEMLMRTQVVEVSDPEMLEQVLSSLVEKSKDENETNT